MDRIQKPSFTVKNHIKVVLPAGLRGGSFDSSALSYIPFMKDEDLTTGPAPAGPFLVRSGLIFNSLKSPPHVISIILAPFNVSA
jgi:hypothetical protein